ncbi:heavy metal-binding domain-containing protein, partial [Thiolapillus sp.]
EALQVKAAEMGGNAVIGVSIDFEFIPGKSGMLMATAAGTVVQISVQGQP